MLDALGARSTLKIEHTEPGMGHYVLHPEITQMVSFIRGDVAASTAPSATCASAATPIEQEAIERNSPGVTVDEGNNPLVQ